MAETGLFDDIVNFDIEGAQKAGYSLPEITKYLAEQSRFDYIGAVKSGYTDSQISQYLTQQDGAVSATNDATGSPSVSYKQPVSGTWNTVKDVAKELPKGVVRGIDALGAMGGGAIKLVGDVAGIEKISSTGDSIGRFYTDRALRDEVTQDVSGEYGGTKSAVGTIGEMIPMMAPTGIGASLGKAALTRGAIANLSKGVGRTSAQQMVKVAGSPAAMAVDKAAKTGVIAGMGAGVYAGGKGKQYVKKKLME